MIQHGVIELGLGALPERLGILWEALENLRQRYRPDQVVVEKIFLKNNPQSAFVLGHARGVILAWAGFNRLSLAEYYPREVKKNVTGTGSASKERVAQSLIYRLGPISWHRWDSTDALALAYHHLLMHKGNLGYDC